MIAGKEKIVDANQNLHLQSLFLIEKFHRITVRTNQLFCFANALARYRILW